MIKGISVAMIVENEIEIIQDCLDSVYELADEIVVYLDCHSNDGTREVLEKCDKVKIYENVYDRSVAPFHFGKARNESLKKCKYEWTVIIDGDEVLNADQQEVRTFLMAQPADCVFLCEVKQKIGTSVPVELTQHRIFPTRKGFYYDGEVHNQPNWDRKRLAEASVAITFDHPGYGNQAKMERRLERTKVIQREMRIRVAESGGDMGDYYNLMKMTMVIGDEEQAYRFGIDGMGQFVRLTGEEQRRYHRYLLTLVRCMMMLGEWHGVKELLDMHLAIAGEMVDSCYLTFCFHYRQGEMISALLSGMKYLELMEIERLTPLRFETTLSYKRMVMEKVTMLTYYVNEGLVL